MTVTATIIKAAKDAGVELELGAPSDTLRDYAIRLDDDAWKTTGDSLPPAHVLITFDGFVNPLADRTYGLFGSSYPGGDMKAAVEVSDGAPAPRIRLDVLDELVRAGAKVTIETPAVEVEPEPILYAAGERLKATNGLTYFVTDSQDGVPLALTSETGRQFGARGMSTYDQEVLDVLLAGATKL